MGEQRMPDVNALSLQRLYERYDACLKTRDREVKKTSAALYSQSTEVRERISGFDKMARDSEDEFLRELHVLDAVFVVGDTAFFSTIDYAGDACLEARQVFFGDRSKRSSKKEKRK